MMEGRVYTGVFLFSFVILYGVIGNSVSSPLELVERPPCNQTLSSLSSLREAALDLSSHLTDSVYVMCVNLEGGNTPEGVGYSPVNIDSISVIITGSPGSVIKCCNDQQLPLSDYTQFPLIFTNSSLVIMEGVQFEGCMRPLKFKWVTRIEIISSTFRNFFPGGVFDISNSPQVVVSNCTFTNNTSLGIGMERYSGNAGAVAIGYDDQPIPEHLQNLPPIIRITGSTFKDNNSTALEELQYDAAQVLGSRIYNQRGGGVACYFGTSNYSADVEIKGCTFEGNYVRDSGGSIYMFLSGHDNGHSVKIRECDIGNNEASVGGGVELTFDTVVNIFSRVRLNSAFIENCNFSGNTGRYGGGYSLIQVNTRENLNNVTVRNCSFTDNKAPVGSAMYLQYVYTVNHASLKKMIFVEDCTFLNNTAIHGVLFASRNTVGILGNTIFRGCVGPAIQSFGSLITFEGQVLFDSNSNHPEGFSGVLHLAAFGQIMLRSGVNMTFTNNTGAEGGTIAVTGQLVSTGSTKQLYNPQCFLQYENARTPPPLWNVHMVFEGNQAAVGPIIYASNLEVCTWFKVNSPFFNARPQDGWIFMERRDNYILRGNTRLLKPDLEFQTIIKNLSLAENQASTVMASPGESMTVNVVATDEYDHETTAFLEIKDEATVNPVRFEPSIVQAAAGDGQITLRYLSSDEFGNTTVQLLPSFTTEELSGINMKVVHTSCLPGYFLSGGRCICEETNIVALCDPEKRGVILNSGLWGAPPNWSRELVTYICPPGYCDCSQGFDDNESIGCLLNYTNPDEICSDIRTGLLCGQCVEGYGVGLLTNECKEFPHRLPQFWLFPIYLSVLVPLLVVIVKFGVHLPTILRGFIFYVQISPIAVEFLPQSFRLRSDIMSCIASTLAFYVPYDFNFHEGMTSLESYGLRYVTPLVALIVVPIAVRVRRPHSKYWFGVWTIVQLLFIMTINTSISLLLCPRFTRKTPSITSTITLWFYDGSVQCYRGWHILLAIVALLFLLTLGTLIIVVTAALQFKLLHRKVHPSFAKLEPFSVALTRGFKKQYSRWWPMTDLTCRYIFVIAVVLSVGNKVVPLFLSIIFFLVQFYLHPYEDRIANYLESFVLLVLVVLLGLGNTTVLVDNVDDSQRYYALLPLYYLPVLVGGVTAVIYIAYQIQKLYKEKKQSSKWKRSTKVTKRNMSLYKHKLRQVTRSEISFSGRYGKGEVEEEEEEEGEGPTVDTVHSVSADSELINENHTQLLTTV